jgi:hypothetical protein
MDTTHGLAAILRDARKGALLRMRSIFFTGSFAGTTAVLAFMHTPIPLPPLILPARCRY